MKRMLCLLLLPCALIVNADVKVTATDSSGQTVMFMNRDSVLINIGSANQSVLYDAQADAFKHLNHDERSYMEFDQEMIQDLSAGINAAMGEMQKAMASMPKEQQDMMARFLGKAPPEEKPAEPKREITKTGKKQEVNGVPCVLYTLTENGELISEMWVASYRALKIKPSDVEGFRKLTAFQEKMMESFKNNPMAKQNMKSGMSLHSDIDGFPLLVKSYSNGVVENEFKVDSVLNIDDDGSRYRVPANYRKQEMPGMGGGGRGGFGGFNL